MRCKLGHLSYRQLYFLYVWNEPCEGQATPQTRYRLEEAATHAQYLFEDIDALAEFLRTRKMPGQTSAEGTSLSSPH